jgi:hypothetical protein
MQTEAKTWWWSGGHVASLGAGGEHAARQGGQKAPFGDALELIAGAGQPLGVNKRHLLKSVIASDAIDRTLHLGRRRSEDLKSSFPRFAPHQSKLPDKSWCLSFVANVDWSPFLCRVFIGLQGSQHLPSTYRMRLVTIQERSCDPLHISHRFTIGGRGLYST